MIRCSLGTAKVLGLKRVKADVLPTTAYLMVGERCKFNCAFCAQARESGARADQLSRVVWPGFKEQEVLEGLQSLEAHKTLRRVCFQVVQETEVLQEVKNLVGRFRNERPDLPICVSAGPRSLEEIGELLANGVEHVSLALDAANAEIFAQVKDGSWEARYDLLTQAAAKFPGRITTHLIVGLGESEEEMIQRLQDMQDKGIRVALFAFTPVKGTRMEKVSQPEIGHYRRIQAAHYLIRNGYAQAKEFRFKNGKLINYSLPLDILKKYLADGEAFRTSGCPGCNRPYYNESPGGELYNYPRPLTPEEVERAWELLISELE